MWKKFQDELVGINDIRIDRCLSTLENVIQYQLHGFSDASEIAFGACVYLRAVTNNDQVSTQLICSKSRVAPLKQLTIPRLELCGAVLLAKLMNITMNALDMKIDASFYWTDSSIVLCWIRFKIFVGNRITEIQTVTCSEDWRHVRTDVNPADCLSRGLTPVKLNNHELWWKGPSFLNQPVLSFPMNFDTDVEDLSEEKTIKTVLTTITHNEEFNIYIERFESYQRMIRVTAFILRFATNCRKLVSNKRSCLRSHQLPVKLTSHQSVMTCLTTKELSDSQFLIVKLVQKQVFKDDLKQLIKDKQVGVSSKLKLLNPFLDKNNIIRVGGRITHSLVPYNQKHPILLPQDHHFTKIFIKNEHHRHLHAGTQATLAAVRQTYWPTNGKASVKAITSRCHGCIRVAAISPSQIMADLPELRVQQFRAFKNTGVDFCGPFNIKNKNQIGGAIQKAYISVFVCFSTIAIHLEVVSDLTSASFKAALIRFISRRGICSNLHSDSGTNFVGTSNERKEFQKFIINHETNKDISEFCNSNNINWKFIPPRSPHHGGIWEAGVKSVKYHLKRVVQDSIMTFEELTTFSTQVESCLNSRPLTPLSTDPNDLEALTPGHFLIFEPLTTIPDHCLIDLKVNRLSRWQKIQQLCQLFWKRWSIEYLNQLQQRKKWTKIQPNLQKDDFVIIKEDNLPCTQWLLGRIVSVVSGADNKVRVVSILTKNGLKERSISKLMEGQTK